MTRRGIATIEFAVIAPLLLLLVAAVVDYSLLMRSAIAVGDAARAGAQYGSLSTANASNISGMVTAALNAAPDINGLTATAAKVCKCSNGSTVNCSGGTCPSGAVRTYAQVTVKTTVNAIFSYPQLRVYRRGSLHGHYEGAMRGRRGSTMLEGALVMTTFVILLVGAMDFGRLGFTYNSVTYAAHQAARFAATNGSASGHLRPWRPSSRTPTGNLVGMSAKSLTVSVTWTPNNKPRQPGPGGGLLRFSAPAGSHIVRGVSRSRAPPSTPSRNRPGRRTAAPYTPLAALGMAGGDQYTPAHPGATGDRLPKKSV